MTTSITTGATSGAWQFASPRRAKKIFRQTGKAFCLDAVVQSLCAHYDLPIPAGAEIRRIAETTAKGASIAGAKAALEAAGFHVEAGTCKFQQLRQLNGPAIAMVNRTDGSLHYVIINRAKFGKVEVLDPAGGITSIYTQKNFEAIWTRTILLASPIPNSCFELMATQDPYRWLRNAFWNRRYLIGSAVIAVLLQTVLIMLSLYLLREMLGSVRHDARQFQILGIIVSFAVCAVFKALCHNIYESIRNSIRKQLSLDLQIQASEKIQDSDSVYLEQNDCRELAKSCQTDAARIGLHFAFVCDAFIQAIIVIVLIAIAGKLDNFGFVFSFLVAISVLLPTANFLPCHTQFYLERKLSDANSLVQKLLSENLAGIKPLRCHKGIGARKHEVKRRQLHAFRIAERLQQLKFRSKTIGLAAASISAALILFLSYASTPNQPGIIISQFILGNLTAFSLRKFSVGIANWSELVHHVRRFQDLVLDAPRSNCQNQSIHKVAPAGKMLCFDRVTQQFGTSVETAYSNFSFTIRQGQSVQWIDNSGQRNEYLVRWLLGQTAIENGSIKIDGLNIRDLSKSQLQKLCGICPTEPYIFQTELSRNICPGNRMLNLGDLDAVVKSVGLTDLIDKLPQRYETIIGKSGMFTSWEERYRIGLARLEVLKAPIIIVELPKYQMTKSLMNTINQMIRTRWQNRIVFVLSNRYHSGIQCDSAHRIGRFGEIFDLDENNTSNSGQK